MSCSNCGSITAGCGCKDTAYTTPVASTCVPACPPKCAEYTSATCVLMNDGINELGSNPGDTLESIIQRITLILTNPLCVDWIPGSGGGGGGGGIVSVGLVTSSNLFETPISPVTTPGGDLILNLSDQSANTVFAGPAAGPADTPAFRSLVIADIPSLTTGTSLLMGNGSGFFDNVTIGTNLSFSGGVLNANVNVVIGADNGLTKDPLSPDTVWLGGPVSAPGTLIQETFIDATNQYRLNLYGNNPASKRGVLEVEHTANETAIKAIADTGIAVSANTIDNLAVYASSTGTGIGLVAESVDAEAIQYSSTNKGGITGNSKDENIFVLKSTTPPNDGTISSVLRLTKSFNATSTVGIGSRLDFGFYNSSNIDKTSGTVASVATVVTAGAETADLEFSVIGNGTIEKVGRFIGRTNPGNGQLQLIKYGINTFSVGTPLYGLAVDGTGKVMEVPLASGIGTVDNGLSLNPSLSTEAWLGGTLVNPAGTFITVPNTFDFIINGDTSTTNKSVLEINNTAGATATRALTVTSGGVSPAVYVSQASTGVASGIFVKNLGTASTSYGILSETVATPFYGKTTQATNTTQVELLKLHNQTGGGGGNGIGGYISLSAATVSNADQEAARIAYQYTDATTATRKSQLEFYTANTSLLQRMLIQDTGQIRFNAYTTATSFVTALGASLLGVDTSGNVVNSTGAEGLSFNGLTANVELGRSALAGTSDLTGSRFINAGTNTINVSGEKKALTAHPYITDTSPAVIRGINIATNLVTERSIGVLGSSSGEFAYGVYGSAIGASGIGVYGVNTTGGSGIGVFGNGSQAGVWGTSTTGNAVRGEASAAAFSSIAGVHSNAAGYAIEALKSAATSGQITPAVKIEASSSGNVGANGLGSAIDFRAATVTTGNTKNQVRLGAWWSDATTSVSTANFTVYVANLGGTPVSKLNVAGSGQITFTDYTSATAFTTTTGVSLLGVDSGGKVVNGTAVEGLSFNALTGNVELGRSVLAGTSDFSGDRFINSGTNQFTIQGDNSVATTSGTALQNAAILKVVNTDTTTNSSVGIYAQISSANNTVTNVTGAAAIQGVFSGTGDDGVAIYGYSTGSNVNNIAIKGETTSGIAGYFKAVSQTSLIASVSGTVGTAGTTALRAENTGTGDLTKVINTVSLTRSPGSNLVGAGGGSAITYEMNAAGSVPGVYQVPDLVRLIGYAVDLSVNGSWQAGFKIAVTHNSVETDRIDFYGADIIRLTQNIPGPYADDIAASGAGVPQYALYRDASSNVKICQI